MTKKTNGRPRSTAHLIARVYANPRYRGKRVIIIHGNVFPSAGGKSGFRHLKALLQRYPGETPTIVYVPKAESLIFSPLNSVPVPRVPRNAAIFPEPGTTRTASDFFQFGS